MAGLDLPIDEPNSSDRVLEFLSDQFVEESANELLNQLKGSAPL